MEKTVKKESKVWIVSELFYPEMISTGYIMTEIANNLAKSHHVEVIAGPLFYEEKINESIDQDKPLFLSIHRTDNIKYNKNSLLTRVFGNIKIAWSLFILMKKHIPDRAHILMVTNPIMLVFFVSLICKGRKWNIKLLVHDIFPENLLVLNHVKSKIILFMPLLKWSFNKAFSKMNCLIVLGRDMKDVLEKKNKRANVVIIENWANTDDILPQYSPSVVNRFLFAGNLGRVQGIETLLCALNQIDLKKTSFEFVGTGAMSVRIEEFIRRNPNKRVYLTGWVPREKQNELFGRADIGVITLEKGMYGLGVPSKLYNLLAAGKPVFYIGDIGSEIQLLLTEYKFGWFAKAGDLINIIEVMKKIIDTDHATLLDYSKNARTLACEFYSKEIILNKFNRLFSDEHFS